MRMPFSPALAREIAEAAELVARAYIDQQAPLIAQMSPAERAEALELETAGAMVWEGSRVRAQVTQSLARGTAGGGWDDNETFAQALAFAGGVLAAVLRAELPRAVAAQSSRGAQANHASQSARGGSMAETLGSPRRRR